MSGSFNETFAIVVKNTSSFTSFDIKDADPTLDITYIDQELEHLEHLKIIELELNSINGKQYKLK